MSPLVVRDLSRGFGGLRALDSVSFEMAPGERRAIIGTNGAGKTTLFNLIAGQIAPSAGEVRLFGRDATRLAAHQRAALGLARTFQITSLFPELTVAESMLLAVQALDPCHFSFWRPRSAYPHVARRARELIERWRLEAYRDEPVRTLSYGTQRQLEIVLALASEPRLLLLDEPMAGLSAAEAEHATALIRDLDRSITILFIEHQLEAAFRIADRITALDQGRVVADGPPERIREAAELQRIYTRSAASDGR